MADPSAVSISNSALLMIGDASIASLTDSSNRAIICNHFYDEVRDATLRAFPWNFATRYLDFGAVLASEVPITGFDFTNAFALPTSPNHVLRVLHPTDRDMIWKVVGQFIYTNESEFKAKCIIRVDSESEFDALFRECFAARLAATIAWPLSKNRALSQDSWAIYKELMQEAYEVDSHEGLPDDMESDALLSVRY